MDDGPPRRIKEPASASALRYPSGGEQEQVTETACTCTCARKETDARINPTANLLAVIFEVHLADCKLDVWMQYINQKQASNSRAGDKI